MNPQDQSTDLPQLNNDSNMSAAQPPAQDDSISSMPPPSDAGRQYKEVSLPTEAEDTDLIEKEWVERAKQIVEHTREDPYEQQRALSQMKADYLKKRYNKDIKVSDD